MMETYLKQFVLVDMAPALPGQAEILVALLAEAGFDGFEEKEGMLTAAIEEKKFDQEIVSAICGGQGIGFTHRLVEDQNWNQIWERGFEPVKVGSFAGIRADFHAPMADVQHELVITPKMSFGTGHHATTYLMIEQMRLFSLEGCSVLDFGTGTGVLAILAEKLGADSVVGIDNDEWSIRNAEENLGSNHCSKIRLLQADTPRLAAPVDVILANINKNVILSHFGLLVSQLKPGGVLLLSGLLASDEDDVFRNISAYSLHLVQTSVRNNWLCMRVSR